MPTAPQTRTRIVQSRHNPRVKELRAALLRPTPERIGIEGMHLVEEALRSGLAVQTIFVRAGAEALLASLAQQSLACVPEILILPEEVLHSVVTTESPQAVAALVTPPRFSLADLFRDTAGSGCARASSEQSLLVVLAGLQDPGNVGTIVRSAEAFGAHGVLALPGTASVWNPKSLRASMGSAFRLPVVAATVEQAFAALSGTLSIQGLRSFAAVAPSGGGQALCEIDLCPGTALWIGSEGAGLTADIVARCDAAITIHSPGPVDSLNAAVAASLLLYEAWRQRSSSSLQQALRHPSAP